METVEARQCKGSKERRVDHLTQHETVILYSNNFLVGGMQSYFFFFNLRNYIGNSFEMNIKISMYCVNETR